MIAQFALRLICGMSLMWALMPRRQVASGFFRIQMLVVMGLGVLATLAAGMELQTIIGATPSSQLGSLVLLGLHGGLIASLGLLGFVGSALWTLERRPDAEWVGFSVLLISTALIVAPNFIPNVVIYFADSSVAGMGRSLTASRLTSALTAVSEFASAALLGSTVVGMLLGHWYLTAPTMSIDPLKRLNQFLGVAGWLRLFVSITVLGLLLTGMLDTPETPARLAAVPKAWLGLRWLAGIIGPIVVSLMVWRILKYRNTQAATGVLFVGVILAFIGDMTAALLLRETTLPL